MKNGILLLCLILSANTFAQAPQKVAEKTFEYRIKGNTGNNGTAVAWNPSLGVYMCVFAGNKEFPFESFSTKGESLSINEAGFDFRGLWYNPSTKKLEGNGAGKYGWVSIKETGSVKPNTIENIAAGMNQPDFQSVGTYDPKKKMVVFIDPELAELVFHKRAKPSSVSRLKLEYPNRSNFSSTSVGFTGVKNYEYCILNTKERNVVFFNRKGKQTGECKLPASAPVNKSFNFSFTNKLLFLFDVDDRTWIAYSVF